MAEHIIGLISDLQRPGNDYRQAGLHLKLKADVLVSQESKEAIAIGVRIGSLDKIRPFSKVTLLVATNGSSNKTPQTRFGEDGAV